MKKPYAIAAAVHEGHIDLGLYDAQGHGVETWTIPQPPEPVLTLPHIAETVLQRAQKHGISLLEVEGIGLTRRESGESTAHTERRLSILTGLRVRCASLPRPDLNSSLELLNDQKKG